MQRNFTVLFLLLVVLSALPQVAQAQRGRRNSNEIIAEPKYDDPKSIYKMFVGLTPVYSDMFVTNVTWGAGADAMIFPRSKIDGLPAKYAIHIQGRTTYAPDTDLTRFIYRQNVRRINQDLNPLLWYTYLELGGEYHFFENEEVKLFKFPVIKKSYDAADFESTVNDDFKLDATRRTLVSARLGFWGYQSAVDIGGILLNNPGRLDSLQGTFTLNDDTDPVDITFNDLATQQESVTGDDPYAFTNILVGGIYVGTSMRWNWNAGVDPTRHDFAVLDAIITGYADFLVAPYVEFQDFISYDNRFRVQRTSLDPYRNRFGGRAGIDLAFNRQFGWGLNGEIGYRPGVKISGLYFMASLRFPVFGTNLDYSREAFTR